MGSSHNCTATERPLLFKRYFMTRTPISPASGVYVLWGYFREDKYVFRGERKRKGEKRCSGVVLVVRMDSLLPPMACHKAEYNAQEIYQ